MRRMINLFADLFTDLIHLSGRPGFKLIEGIMRKQPDTEAKAAGQSMLSEEKMLVISLRK